MGFVPSWVYIVIAAIALVVGLTGVLKAPSADGYQPSYSIPEGQEVMMVYVGSSTCGFANQPGMPEVIEQAKLSLQQQALDSGFSFSAVGVSIDWDVSEGNAHLAKMGRFDEIMTGRRLWGVAGQVWEEFIIGTPPDPGYAIPFARGIIACNL